MVLPNTNRQSRHDTDRVEFVIDDGSVYLRATRSIVRDLAGSISPLPGSEHVDFEEVRHLVLEDLADKIVRDMGGR